MGPRATLRFIRRHRLSILAGLVIGAGAGFAISSQMARTYEATATVIVNQNPAATVADKDLLTPGRLTDSYVPLVTQPSIVQAVAKKLNITPDGLSEKIAVTPTRDTQLLRISARDTSADQAASIASTTAQVFADDNAAQPGRAGVLRVVKAATTPSRPASPNLPGNVATGLLLGLIAAVAFGWLRDRRLAAAADTTFGFEETVRDTFNFGPTASVADAAAPMPIPALPFQPAMAAEAVLGRRLSGTSLVEMWATEPGNASPDDDAVVVAERALAAEAARLAARERAPVIDEEAIAAVIARLAATASTSRLADNVVPLRADVPPAPVLASPAPPAAGHGPVFYPSKHVAQWEERPAAVVPPSRPSPVSASPAPSGNDDLRSTLSGILADLDRTAMMLRYAKAKSAQQWELSDARNQEKASGGNK